MSCTKARPNRTSTFCVMFCTGRMSLLYPLNKSLTNLSSSSLPVTEIENFDKPKVQNNEDIDLPSQILNTASTKSGMKSLFEYIILKPFEDFFSLLQSILHHSYSIKL